MTAPAHLRSLQGPLSQGAAANPSRPCLSRTSSRSSSSNRGKACPLGRASELPHKETAGTCALPNELLRRVFITVPSDYCRHAVLVCHIQPCLSGGPPALCCGSYLEKFA